MFNGKPPQDLVASFEQLELGVSEMISRNDGTVNLKYGVEETFARIEPLVQNALAESVAAMTRSIMAMMFSGGDVNCGARGWSMSE